MQVTPIPIPPVPTALPQAEAAAKTIPQVQAQAAAPIVQRAVDPSPKSDRGGQTRSNSDKTKGGDKGSGEKRGGSVNIRV